jgi:Mn2+/Fe2+ NRAMP family transporter
VAAVVFMLTYTSLGAKLGVVTGRSVGDLITEQIGRPLAVLIGAGVFFISAAFQLGNNLGLHAAVAGGFGFHDRLAFLNDGILIAFNGLSILFLFAFRNLYRAIERLMMILVGVMLLSFALNLGFARPDLGAFAGGLIPGGRDTLDINLLGLVGTTFVITAALYQSYLVRQKGWSVGQLADGLIDARVSAVIMAVITLMIMTTAAAVLRGRELENVDDVAAQLGPLFGPKGKFIFCVGLFSAAYSSFLINSMIGGFILSDCLGFKSSQADFAPRAATCLVLLTGMSVALAVKDKTELQVPAIVAAQAVTVPAAPLIAGILWWLTSRSKIMGIHRNGVFLNVAAGLGFLLLLAMAYYTAVEKVWPNISPQIWKLIGGQ